jgi:hypothetical protein
LSRGGRTKLARTSRDFELGSAALRRYRWLPPKTAAGDHAGQRIREAVKAINIDPAKRVRELVAEAQLDLMQ